MGFRPTTGRYPGAGIVPIARTRDTAGPMARSVADVALMDSVLSGGTTTIDPVNLVALRIGVPRTSFFEENDESVLQIADQTLER